MAVGLGLVCLCFSGAARAQDDLEDVFRDLGTATVDKEALPADRKPGDGTIRGQVIDGETGVPVEGVTVIVVWPAPADGSEPHQEVAVTDVEGAYELASVPPGTYTINFVKSGYRSASMTNFEVLGDQLNLADFPLPPLPAESSEEVLELEAFVVEASVVGEIMDSLELRLDSDALLNVMSAEDLSKFAASDVADALKRVSGVNVVEGRFAVIRGLEDRYSSTTFNRAPVPSADPLRQSVQLDLFPSDVVTGLVIAKTFEAAAPGNSGAGSIDIGTLGYPEEPTFKLAASSGFNDNATKEFLGYQNNSPIADFKDSQDVIESDFSGFLGGSWKLFRRQVQAKFVAAQEIDYDTALGWVHAREPSLPTCSPPGPTFPVQCQSFSAATVIQAGGLALGQLDVSDGRFDYTLSMKQKQFTAFGGLGIDLDPEGEHRLDFTAFYTDKKIEAVERLDDGIISPFDYANTPVQNFGSPFTLYHAGARDGTAVATVSGLISSFRQDPEQLDSGPLGIDPIVRGQSVTQDRTLSIYQLNGRHDLARLLEGLRFDWAANYARTKQDETSYRMRYWYEPYSAVNFSQSDLPVPPFPPQESDFPVAEFGPGSWRTNTQDIIYNENKVDETQWFGRGDFGYEVEPIDWLVLDAAAGFWVERADRTLEFTDYLGDPPAAGGPGYLNGIIEGPTEQQLGPNVYASYGLGNLLDSESKFKRDITAGYLSLKGTFWDDFDVVGGLRLEEIYIKSDNRPFTGTCLPPRGRPTATDPSRSGRGCPDGYLPAIFPGRYLYLDRQDNLNNPFFFESSTLFAPFGNQDEILGINLPVSPDGFVDQLSAQDMFDVLTGEIDKSKLLPTVAVAYRPLDGLTLRGAYSETTARPSFRELAYYASIVPGEDDRLVGNPFLQLSDVTSYDARAEYVWGDVGNLAAVSFFYKTIDNPIEVIQLRDFSVAGFPLFEGPFRVYRNNENQADLIGGEAEARVTLGTLSRLAGGNAVEWLDFLDYVSIGGNFTYIHADVERSEFERSFGDLFYLAPGDNPRGSPSSSLDDKRRLFNQPEWIVNGDISFDQPDWGTKLTLSVFSISDVLRAAGFPTILRGGQTIGLGLDEYTASFYQLDAVATQSFEIPWVKGSMTLKGSLKNLTNSKRGIVYDTEVVDDVRERRFTVGRDYSFGLQYELIFGGE